MEILLSDYKPIIARIYGQRRKHQNAPLKVILYYLSNFIILYLLLFCILTVVNMKNNFLTLEYLSLRSRAQKHCALLWHVAKILYKPSLQAKHIFATN